MLKSGKTGGRCIYNLLLSLERRYTFHVILIFKTLDSQPLYFTSTLGESHVITKAKSSKKVTTLERQHSVLLQQGTGVKKYITHLFLSIFSMGEGEYLKEIRNSRPVQQLELRKHNELLQNVYFLFQEVIQSECRSEEK